MRNKGQKETVKENKSESIILTSWVKTIVNSTFPVWPSPIGSESVMGVTASEL